MIGHVGDSEIRSPVPGEVRAFDRPDGDATVHVGDPVVDLGVDPDHAYEALRALYLVGQADDLEDVQRFTRPGAAVTEKVVRQAMLTAEAIQERSKRR
jgi:hypothetical protein